MATLCEYAEGVCHYQRLRTPKGILWSTIQMDVFYDRGPWERIKRAGQVLAPDALHIGSVRWLVWRIQSGSFTGMGKTIYYRCRGGYVLWVCPFSSFTRWSTRRAGWASQLDRADICRASRNTPAWRVLKSSNTFDVASICTVWPWGAPSYQAQCRTSVHAVATAEAECPAQTVRAGRGVVTVRAVATDGIVFVFFSLYARYFINRCT